jgi:hypothetical protein
MIPGEASILRHPAKRVSPMPLVFKFQHDLANGVLDVGTTCVNQPSFEQFSLGKCSSDAPAPPGPKKARCSRARQLRRRAPSNR